MRRPGVEKGIMESRTPLPWHRLGRCSEINEATQQRNGEARSHNGEQRRSTKRKTIAWNMQYACLPDCLLAFLVVFLHIYHSATTRLCGISFGRKSSPSACVSARLSAGRRNWLETTNQPITDRGKCRRSVT